MVFFLLVTGVLLFSIAVRTSVYGGVEQLVAHKAHNLEIVGSSPASATMGTNTPEILSSLVRFAF